MFSDLVKRLIDDLRNGCGNCKDKQDAIRLATRYVDNRAFNDAVENAMYSNDNVVLKAIVARL